MTDNGITYLPAYDLIETAESEALNIISKAQKQALNIISKARKKAAKTIFNKYLKAKKIGFKNGEKKFLLSKIQKLNENLQAINEYIKSLKDDCFETSLNLCKEVIQTEMTESSTSLAHRIEQSLASCFDRQDIRIFVNPHDFNNLLSTELAPYLIKNEQILLGNAIINSPIGRIEINWHEHFDLLKQFIESRL